jgi:hypothetical protein
MSVTAKEGPNLKSSSEKLSESQRVTTKPQIMPLFTQQFVLLKPACQMGLRIGEAAEKMEKGHLYLN